MADTAMSRLRDKLDAARADFAARGGMRNGRRRPASLTRQIVQTSRWDTIEWTGNAAETDELFTAEPIAGARQDPEIDSAIKDLFYGDIANPEKRPGYLNGPELLQDIFMAFFKPQPSLHKKQEVATDARLNQRFIVQLMDLPEYGDLHDYTMADAATAKDATLAFVEVIKEMIRQHREAVEEANRQREEEGCDPQGQPGNQDNKIWDDTETPKTNGTSDGTGDDDSNGDDSNDGDSDGDSESDTDGDGLDDVEREFDDSGEHDQEEADWQQMVDNVDFGALMHTALRETSEEVGQLTEARRGIGLDDATWKMMDPSQRAKVADRLNTAAFRALADMVGKMKRYALARQAEKIIDAPHEIVDVEQGNDLRRVLRQEFGLLGNPGTRIEFFRRYANGELLQYKERGREKVGKGPVVVCVDNSSSMSGRPETWAKGVAEALRRICQDQGRDYYVMFFGTNRQRDRFDFPGGKGPFEKILACLSISAGGGTEFDGVLTEALAKARAFAEATPQHGKSDIVFITDGEARLNASWIEDFNRSRKEADVRVFSIYISAYDSRRSAVMPLLESFSDVTIPVSALEVNDVTTSTLFAHI